TQLLIRPDARKDRGLAHDPGEIGLAQSVELGSAQHARVRDASRARDCPRRLWIVTRDHDDAYARRATLAHRFRHAFAQRVSQSDETCERERKVRSGLRY